MAETRGWLGDVLTRRGADASALEALDGAPSRRLRDHPEALRLLRA
jgi:hypothetical protein